MQTKTLVLFGLLAIIVILSSCEGKRSLSDDSDDSEPDEQRVRTLFEDDENADDDLDKRENYGTCVPCKFGTIPCCKPNICKKRLLLPNKCVRVKG